MKKVIILNHNGGRLANQLWLHANVLAYCIEKGYELENYSFFEYSQHFAVIPKNKIVDLLFYKSFITLKPLSHLFGKYHSRLYNYFFKKCYNTFSFLFSLFAKKNIIASNDSDYSKITYLPPSNNINSKIVDYDNNNKKIIYLSGWLFRNPVGILKHQKQIVDTLSPKDELVKEATDFVSRIRLKYKNVFGLHIRQGDYKTYRNGELYFTSREINNFLSIFLKQFNLPKEDSCFITCSDGPINTHEYNGVNIVISNHDDITDLLILSMTDKIIGSDSTYGAFASYFGNIPIIVFSREEIDWDYYINKDIFFENKYLTSVHF